MSNRPLIYASRESASERRQREGVVLVPRKVIEPKSCFNPDCKEIIPAVRVAESPKVKYCVACGFKRKMGYLLVGKRKKARE